MSAEDARERGELQRAYYSLLHATTHNELTGVLLAAPAATRDAALEGLVRGAASHVDAIVRKTCMQVGFFVSSSCSSRGVAPLAAGTHGAGEIRVHLRTVEACMLDSLLHLASGQLQQKVILPL